MQGPKEIGDVDTDDEKDEEAQYEQWKSRELARIRCAGSTKLKPLPHSRTITCQSAYNVTTLQHYPIGTDCCTNCCWFCASV